MVSKETKRLQNCYLLLTLGGDVFGGGGASVTLSFVGAGLATCPLVFEAAINKIEVITDWHISHHTVNFQHILCGGRNGHNTPLKLSYLRHENHSNRQDALTAECALPSGSFRIAPAHTSISNYGFYVPNHYHNLFGKSTSFPFW